MSEYDPELSDTHWETEREFGGAIVSRDEISTEKIDQEEISNLETFRKRTVYREGEVMFVEGTLETGEEISGCYIVVDAGYPRKRSHHVGKQFRVLEHITGSHRLVAHNSGERYKIPADTQYPCTHSDIPDEELIPFQNPPGKHASRDYSEKLLPTEWLAQAFDLESNVLAHHI